MSMSTVSKEGRVTWETRFLKPGKETIQIIINVPPKAFNVLTDFVRKHVNHLC